MAAGRRALINKRLWLAYTARTDQQMDLFLQVASPQQQPLLEPSAVRSSSAGRLLLVAVTMVVQGSD